MRRIRILLADDHLMLIGAFKSVLEPKYEVVGLVTDGRALLEAAERLQPDVIVTDIAMPQLNGLDAARKLKEKTPGIKLIFITMNPDPYLVREAFRAGASAFLLKQEACSGLPAAIEQVLKGGTYASPQTSEGQLNISLREPKDRERSEERRVGKEC